LPRNRLRGTENAVQCALRGLLLTHFKNAAALELAMGHTDEDMIVTHYRQLVKPKDAERY
jgi:hypothetical protein